MKDNNKKQNKEENKQKKIRWNIQNAMGCVLKSLYRSEGKIKESKEYKNALERLCSLYNLTTTQLWILCATCEQHYKRDVPLQFYIIADYLNVPIMQIMPWTKDLNVLIDKGYLDWYIPNMSFLPTSGFLHSLTLNTNFIPSEKKEVDELEFFSQLLDRESEYLRGNMNYDDLQNSRIMLEKKYSKFEMIKNVMESIEDFNNRFFLYRAIYDLMRGTDSSLNTSLNCIFMGEDRYKTASNMMKGTHELFKKGLLEFTEKGNLLNAKFTLTSKGKKLVFGEKASLYEDTIDDKNFIKTEDIKSKKLFYSQENQHEIEKLKNALQEDNLNKVQKRLRDYGFPSGLTILLYGAPGTGKTESVYQIAKETGRFIVHLDISECKSVWYGETEKLIKKIFTGYKNACEVCQKKGEKIPIFLFNEADAVMSKRTVNSLDGNCDKTENAMINIILEEVENMQGILIATTNLTENMDKAFERRFLFKIKFDNPSTEAKTYIWMDKLPWLDQSNAEKLAEQFDFSGGQIDNIARKAAMDEVITGIKPDINELYSMCKQEKIDSNNSSSRIGFGV